MQDEVVNSKPFSFSYYEEMLREAMRQGFRISSFSDFNESFSKTVILRHDVDYTLDGLIDMAKIEHDLGCSASYLFRVHAHEYNLFSCVTWSIVREIRALGHEIGLHFEAMNVGRALGIHPPILLKREKQTLEAILGYEVITCSEHREISGVVHSTPLYAEKFDPYEAGFKIFAMDDKYVKQMKYLSDSNAHWREGDLLQHIKTNNRFQILVHPDWWFHQDLLLKGPYYHPTSTHP